MVRRVMVVAVISVFLGVMLVFDVFPGVIRLFAGE